MLWYGNVENAQQSIETVDKTHTARISFNCKPSSIICMRVPCQINSNPHALEGTGGKIIMCRNNDALAMALAAEFPSPTEDIPEPDMDWNGGWVLILPNQSHFEGIWMWTSPSAVACCMQTPWRLEMKGPLRWKNTQIGIQNTGSVLINEPDKDVECITKEDAQSRCVIS